jgi:hypothetical protein
MATVLAAVMLVIGSPPRKSAENVRLPDAEEVAWHQSIRYLRAQGCRLTSRDSMRRQRNNRAREF